jgi:hypothetical protein
MLQSSRSRLGTLMRVRPRALVKDISSAAGLGAAGDVLCQVAVEGRSIYNSDGNRSKIDLQRVSAITLFNAAYIGGFLHFLYRTYPIVVANSARCFWQPIARRLETPSSLAHCVGCGLVDNVHCGMLYIPAYFLGVGLLEGSTIQSARDGLRNEWWSTYSLWCALRPCTPFFLLCSYARLA